MAIFYGVASMIATILFFSYLFLAKNKNKWYLYLFASIMICNAGYFLLSLSKTVDFALFANGVAYVGNVFLPFIMLCMVLEVCRVKYPKPVIYLLIGIGLFMLWLATSGGYLPIYYKSVELKEIEYGVKLVKEYGIMHNLYFIYLFGYMTAMVGTLIYSIKKGKVLSKMHASFLCIIVLGNIIIWLVQQFVEHNFEFLCVSYILNECILLFLMGMLKEYNLILENAQNQTAVTLSDMTAIEIEGRFTPEQVAIVFSTWEEIKDLTKREKEILSHILYGKKRKDIASELFITDSSVRNHTTSIFKKLKVESRDDLCEKAKAKL